MAHYDSLETHVVNCFCLTCEKSKCIFKDSFGQDTYSYLKPFTRIAIFIKSQANLISISRFNFANILKRWEIFEFSSWRVRPIKKSILFFIEKLRLVLPTPRATVNLTTVYNTTAGIETFAQASTGVRTSSKKTLEWQMRYLLWNSDIMMSKNLSVKF